MHPTHLRSVIILVVSVLAALAWAIVTPAISREAPAAAVEPLPPPVETPTPRSDSPGDSAAAAASPVTSPSPSAPGPAESGTFAPDGVEVTYDDSRKITWYNPKFDPWEMRVFRIYPSIARADDGARRIGVTIIVKDPHKGRPTSLQVDTGDEPWIVPISDSIDIETHDSGCRVTQSIFLQNQAPLVQKLAAATRAEITLVGYGHPVHYKMTAGDLVTFRRMATLWTVPALPPALPKPIKGGSPAGTYAAGMSGITNPEIIHSSKVQPRFPKFAEGKNVLGRVVLQAVIRKDGTVGEIEVLRPAGGDCGFEEAAIEAVRKWRYKPGMIDGQPVDVYFTIVVDFTYGSYRMAPG